MDRAFVPSCSCAANNGYFYYLPNGYYGYYPYSPINPQFRPQIQYLPAYQPAIASPTVAAVVAAQPSMRNAMAGVAMNHEPANAPLPEPRMLPQIVAIQSDAVPENLALNEKCLDLIFDQLSVSELLLVSLVCSKWNKSARKKLDKISHLKLISPHLSGRRLLADSSPPNNITSSKEKYFCTSLIPYNSETSKVVSYFDQIDALMENLKNKTITSIDLYDCPLLGRALAGLLNRFGEKLESLSLQNVGCLFNFHYGSWRQINLFLPSLKKLALVQLGFIPKDMPILQQLEEFHLATSYPFIESQLVTDLLLQLSAKLKKLSLNLRFSSDCLNQWFDEKPSIAAGVEVLELYLGRLDFDFGRVCDHFTSLTKLILLIRSYKALYLNIFKNLGKLAKLSNLSLIEDAYNPKEQLISTLYQNRHLLEPLKSVKVLHLVVSLRNYRELDCLKSLFPNLEVIHFEGLTSDSFCICPKIAPTTPDGKKYTTYLTDCETCCSNLKELLQKSSKVRKVYGVEVGLDFEQNYLKEEVNKRPYKWL